jgi:hypothetical protein
VKVNGKSSSLQAGPNRIFLQATMLNNIFIHSGNDDSGNDSEIRGSHSACSFAPPSAQLPTSLPCFISAERGWPHVIVKSISVPAVLKRIFL